MSHYLLSVMEPAGPPPAPEFLEPIMRAVGEVDQAMRDAGVWVYAGGLHQPSTATVPLFIQTYRRGSCHPAWKPCTKTGDRSPATS